MTKKDHSLVELQDDKDATLADVIATLRDYVETGAAISSHTLIEVLSRFQTIPLADKATLSELAQKGANDQLRRRFPQDALKYQDVVSYLQRR